MPDHPKKVNYGFMTPLMGSKYYSPQEVTNYAILAEQAGWNGFFVSDSLGRLALDP